MKKRQRIMKNFKLSQELAKHFKVDEWKIQQEMERKRKEMAKYNITYDDDFNQH